MVDKALKAKIGMIFFLATETMFFVGLLSAYWILKSQSQPWPPPGQPRLPVLITGVNTLILLASGLFVLQVPRAIRRGCNLCIIKWLGFAALGGLIFLGVQGYEWWRLIRFGLTSASNLYGGLFYIIVGSHAIHVAAGLMALIFIFLKTIQGYYTAGQPGELVSIRLYWIFVVLVWPIVYGVVYF